MLFHSPKAVPRFISSVTLGSSMFGIGRLLSEGVSFVDFFSVTGGRGIDVVFRGLVIAVFLSTVFFDFPILVEVVAFVVVEIILFFSTSTFLSSICTKIGDISKRGKEEVDCVNFRSTLCPMKVKDHAARAIVIRKKNCQAICRSGPIICALIINYIIGFDK